MTNDADLTNAKIAAYIGLGSNVGDRVANLGEATERIKTLGIEVVRQSSIYETEPVGFTDQPWFLNQVIEATVFVQPNAAQAGAFLAELLDIEREMGRKRTIANGPRLIDIDLLLFDDLIVQNSNDTASSSKTLGIVLPHPRLHLRRFVLEPLCEIAPDLVHPVLKKLCRELLASLDDDSQVGIYKKT
jgi:2-amino-4-hydroxy-6-hydroxymethyldihydropteridine diphosphokinase